MDKSLLINELNQLTDKKSIEEILKNLSERFSGKVVFTTSFGYEDQVVTDMILSKQLPIKVVTLDTGRLFEETYKVYEKTRQKYGQPIIAYFPDTSEVEKLLNEKGPISFYESLENRKECCYIRKVEPLKRALADAECWITGLRASQSEGRSDLQPFMWDENHRLIKYNPLLAWSLEEIIQYIRDFNVPYNALHDKGFVSIGCEPCTRAIKPGENFRAGRWWWETNSGKECGLHAR